ncbi:Surfactant protein B [Trichostrongylus colubriformis]|uniref:Surfactant protein B n=1 Tax=Trichostrongylus colubriformis TaxID=6319 RepID=A0AAN8F6T0_TRICO
MDAFFSHRFLDCIWITSFQWKQRMVLSISHEPRATRAMKGVIVLVAAIIVAITASGALRKKPLCEMCENLIKKVDEVLQQGGDVQKAVDQFCRDDLPEFLVDYCEKVIAKNLKYIIEKLKDHDPPEKICADIYLCSA